jgi:hypothetical protein
LLRSCSLSSRKWSGLFGGCPGSSLCAAPRYCNLSPQYSGRSKCPARLPSQGLSPRESHSRETSRRGRFCSVPWRNEMNLSPSLISFVQTGRCCLSQFVSYSPEMTLFTLTSLKANRDRWSRRGWVRKCSVSCRVRVFPALFGPTSTIISALLVSTSLPSLNVSFEIRSGVPVSAVPSTAVSSVKIFATLLVGGTPREAVGISLAASLAPMASLPPPVHDR